MSFTKLFYMYMHSGTVPCIKYWVEKTIYSSLNCLLSLVNTINETCWIKTSEVQKLLKWLLVLQTISYHVKQTWNLHWSLSQAFNTFALLILYFYKLLERGTAAGQGMVLALLSWTECKITCIPASVPNIVRTCPKQG